MKKLNLGCGEDIKQDHDNLDFSDFKGVDIILDIEKFPWDIKDNTYDYVFASHILEHVKDLTKTMSELKRICKDNAIIEIRCPHFSCGVTYRDPTHKTFISYHTFDYYTDECFYKNMPQFEIVERKLNFTRLAFTQLNYIINPIINLCPTLYERFFCWSLPCSEALFKLKVVKSHNHGKALSKDEEVKNE